MPGKPNKLISESIMSGVCLGITVTSLYSLIGMGIMIVFLRGPL